MNQADRPAYRVYSERVGCCSGTVSPERIEKKVNELLLYGYELARAYTDVESVCGPCCPRKCVILIFKRCEPDS